MIPYAKIRLMTRILSKPELKENFKIHINWVYFASFALPFIKWNVLLTVVHQIKSFGSALFHDTSLAHCFYTLKLFVQNTPLISYFLNQSLPFFFHYDFPSTLSNLCSHTTSLPFNLKLITSPLISKTLFCCLCTSLSLFSS